ncbi:MAG: MgtC/SapB family protein [Nanoarchaeota archaeon]|nr:MgtC/SapB family protein [Nanoarchaeota archaeon]MBU1321040.1 MgtC/SapB family protein [Nanoarchaeota archaeon]MBU1598454.1 MgtC/SapB family protein [Nanoarchaeota archaeon]MBU2441380.1 MgtC/SapB family protein [Nanoarchaeota archaeon]
MGDYIVSLELKFIIGFVFAVVTGFLIGYERGSRDKPAGVRTTTLVCLGAMLFTMISQQVDPISTSRIAAGVVTGIGFLGAGMILHDKGTVKGLTTAATVWLAAAIGMAIGFGWYLVSIIATLLSFLILRLPHFGEHGPKGR